MFKDLPIKSPRTVLTPMSKLLFYSPNISPFNSVRNPSNYFKVKLKSVLIFLNFCYLSNRLAEFISFNKTQSVYWGRYINYILINTQYLKIALYMKFRILLPVKDNICLNTYFPLQNLNITFKTFTLILLGIMNNKKRKTTGFAPALPGFF